MEFTTNGPVTVTVWWVKNGDSARSVQILNTSGNVVCEDLGECASGTISITTFEIAEAGTYYLGGLTNNNYYFKVEVKVAELAEPETPAEPVIVDIGTLENSTTTDAELVAGSGVYAAAGLTIDGNSKTYEDLSFTKRLKQRNTQELIFQVLTATAK